MHCVKHSSVAIAARKESAVLRLSFFASIPLLLSLLNTGAQASVRVIISTGGTRYTAHARGNAGLCFQDLGAKEEEVCVAENQARVAYLGGGVTQANIAFAEASAKVPPLKNAAFNALRIIQSNKSRIDKLDATLNANPGLSEAARRQLSVEISNLQNESRSQAGDFDSLWQQINSLFSVFDREKLNYQINLQNYERLVAMIRSDGEQPLLFQEPDELTLQDIRSLSENLDSRARVWSRYEATADDLFAPAPFEYLQVWCAFANVVLQKNDAGRFLSVSPYGKDLLCPENAQTSTPEPRAPFAFVSARCDLSADASIFQRAGERDIHGDRVVKDSWNHTGPVAQSKYVAAVTLDDLPTACQNALKPLRSVDCPGHMPDPTHLKCENAKATLAIQDSHLEETWELPVKPTNPGLPRFPTPEQVIANPGTF